MLLLLKEMAIKNQQWKISIPPTSPNLKGKYIAFTFSYNQKTWLKPGKTYAFLAKIDKIWKNDGFTLANFIDLKLEVLILDNGKQLFLKGHIANQFKTNNSLYF